MSGQISTWDLPPAIFIRTFRRLIRNSSCSQSWTECDLMLCVAVQYCDAQRTRNSFLSSVSALHRDRNSVFCASPAKRRISEIRISDWISVLQCNRDAEFAPCSRLSGLACSGSGRAIVHQWGYLGVFSLSLGHWLQKLPLFDHFGKSYFFSDWWDWLWRSCVPDFDFPCERFLPNLKLQWVRALVRQIINWTNLPDAMGIGGVSHARSSQPLLRRL